MRDQNLLLDDLEEHGMGRQATRKLRRKMEEFLQEPKNRDGRGVKTQVKQTSTTTLKHLVRAQKSSESDADPQVRNLARRLVTSSFHVDFESLIELARTFCGQANKHTQTIRESQRRIQMREVIPVGERHTLEKITTSKFLQSVGSQLHNCLRHPRGFGSSFHRDLRSGTSEFWLLSKHEAPLCVIEIDSSNRTIAQCEGRDGSTPELSRSLALNICEKLGVSGDETEAFTQVGAFQIFLKANRNHKPLQLKVENRLLQIWVSESELVIKDRDTNSEKERWSRFEKINDEFSYSWHSEMDVGQLLMLVIEFDELRDELKRVQGVDKPSRARQREIAARRYRRPRGF